MLSRLELRVGAYLTDLCLSEKNELIRTLQSLALGRKGTRVLLKKPAGKEVNPADIFVWNKGFTSERIKFKVNQIQQDMSVSRRHITILCDRTHCLPYHMGHLGRRISQDKRTSHSRPSIRPRSYHCPNHESPQEGYPPAIDRWSR